MEDEMPGSDGNLSQLELRGQARKQSMKNNVHYDNVSIKTINPGRIDEIGLLLAESAIEPTLHMVSK
jgi:hypothetical protein